MRTDSDNLIDAGRRDAAPIRIDEGIPFLVQLNGKLVSLERYCLTPIRARGELRAADIGAVIDYLGRLKDPNTVVFWRPHVLPFLKGKGVAILNFHSSDGTVGHCDHIIRFRCHNTELNKLKTPVIKGTYKAKNI